MFISVVFISCEKDKTLTDYTPTTCIGFESFVLDMPILSRYTSALESPSVEVKLIGEDDLVEYTLTMSTDGSSDEMLHLVAECETIQEMPHQRYYLNSIIIPTVESRSGANQEITVGAILTAESADNISFVSSFDTRTDSVGSGTYADPYTIVSVEDLLDLSSNMIKGSGHTYAGEYIKQTGYIDGTLDYSLDGTGYWAPLGTGAPSVSALTEDGVSFCGTYDGSGLYISNLNSDNIYEVGFFLSLGDGALIKNVNFTSLCFSGDTNVGGLAATVDDGAAVTIEDCNASGYVNGGESIGGFIGSGAARFIGCTSNVSLSKNWNLTYSYTSNVGGFIGMVTEDSSFVNCNFTGCITQTSTFRCGGFVGNCEGSYDERVALSLHHCGVTGSVGGVNDVGGALGRAYYADISFENILIGGTYVPDQLTGEYSSLNGGLSIMMAYKSLYYAGYTDTNTNVFYWEDPLGGPYAGGLFGGCYGSDIEFGAGCTVSDYVIMPILPYADHTVEGDKYGNSGGSSDFEIYLGGIGGGVESLKNGDNITSSNIYSKNSSEEVLVELSFGDNDTDYTRCFVAGGVCCLFNSGDEQNKIYDMTIRLGENTNLSVADAQFIYSNTDNNGPLDSSLYSNIKIINDSKYTVSDVPVCGYSYDGAKIEYTE